MAVALILSALSCKKEKLPATAIYAPNGSVLGASMDDLASRIATVTELESQTLKIASIAFLNAPTGYVAEINFSLDGSREPNIIYMVSKDLLPKLVLDSDLKLVKTNPQGAIARSDEELGAGFIYCSCGSVGYSSSKCQASMSFYPNGTVSGSCTNLDCVWGCYLHYQY